jgi:hypothetical protein
VRRRHGRCRLSAARLRWVSGRWDPEKITILLTEIESVGIADGTVSKSKVAATVAFGILGAAGSRGSKTEVSVVAHLRNGGAAYYLLRDSPDGRLTIRGRAAPILQRAGIPFADQGVEPSIAARSRDLRHELARATLSCSRLLTVMTDLPFSYEPSYAFSNSATLNFFIGRKASVTRAICSFAPLDIISSMAIGTIWSRRSRPPSRPRSPARHREPCGTLRRARGRALLIDPTPEEGPHVLVEGLADPRDLGLRDPVAPERPDQVIDLAGRTVDSHDPPFDTGFETSNCGMWRKI